MIAAREVRMSYDLDQFIADCRTFLQRDPGPKGREQVRQNLERLLNNPDFVRTYCAEDAPRGLKVLYEDPQLGFQILAHLNDKARCRRRTITAPPGRSTVRRRNTPT
jgi:predicted metal-dependent enzyme (double-stranded beta helix superfamily)